MSTLGEAIKFRARAWAGQITILAKSFAPPHIQPYISSHVEDVGDGTCIIRTTVEMVGDGNPPNHAGQSMDARAQEYGSGLHARRGGLKDIIIRPKNGKFLAFPWQVVEGNPSFRHLPDGRVLLPEVHHPGITAANDGQGYLAPAQKAIRERGREELSADVRQAILSDLRASFTHGKG